jgi:hypothetical protein
MNGVALKHRRGGSIDSPGSTRWYNGGEAAAQTDRQPIPSAASFSRNATPFDALPSAETIKGSVNR